MAERTGARQNRVDGTSRSGGGPGGTKPQRGIDGLPANDGGPPSTAGNGTATPFKPHPMKSGPRGI